MSSNCVKQGRSNEFLQIYIIICFDSWRSVQLEKILNYCRQIAYLCECNKTVHMFIKTVGCIIVVLNASFEHSFILCQNRNSSRPETLSCLPQCITKKTLQVLIFRSQLFSVLCYKFFSVKTHAHNIIVRQTIQHCIRNLNLSETSCVGGDSCFRAFHKRHADQKRYAIIIIGISSNMTILLCL